MAESKNEIEKNTKEIKEHIKA
ncbi:hypothetical protein PI23P_10857 [Polaribacter irgensii 23-P]|uniref:Uncharacterized protein n=1 Tax=Polaribacter irgensii 23-P TaxID=313594 RepID=A4C124_9FLAO|nr:hypothetical protein PI23P_10857 [Polaribacter irgensii 23-P]